MSVEPEHWKVLTKGEREMFTELAAVMQRAHDALDATDLSDPVGPALPGRLITKVNLELLVRHLAKERLAKRRAQKRARDIEKALADADYALSDAMAVVDDTTEAIKAMSEAETEHAEALKADYAEHRKARLRARGGYPERAGRDP
jgi:hypothetical protein